MLLKEIFKQNNAIMKITVIGCGAMGGALVRGMIGCGVCAAADITVTARTQATLDGYAPLGVACTTDNRAACAGADVVVVAVKPWVVEQVLAEAALGGTQMLVCLAAGVSAEQLVAWTAGRPQTLTVIPNTAIAVGRSMTFVCPVNADGEHTRAVTELFARMGEALVVDQAHLRAGTVLASCGIAYAMRYVRAAMEGGVEIGFRADEARRVVLQTVAGAVALLQATGAHPEAEIDKVTTAGGITIRGLNAMEHAGFTAAVIDGLKAGMR